MSHETPDGAPPTTVILLTTETSATGSIWRALRAMAGHRWTPGSPIPEYYESGRMKELAKVVPAETGALVLHNAPQNFNFALDLSRYRFILNARDPRDIACNQFAWQQSHPQPGDTPETMAARARAAAEAGVDAFALRKDYRPYFRAFHHVVAKGAPGSWFFLGYAKWCLAFDDATERLARFLDIDPAALPRAARDRLLKERTPEIAANPHWIGHKWAGADIVPGRHRTELRPDTIATLTERYGAELALLRQIDDEGFADTYR